MAEKPPRYKTYNHPAGGWGAAAATAKVLLEQSVVTKGARALLTMNQPGGFKCPSCAFPDAECKKKLNFCENGAKALAHEATKFRVTREFFEKHTVAEMMQQSDYWLEMQERLTEPVRYDAATDKYVPCSHHFHDALDEGEVAADPNVHESYIDDYTLIRDKITAVYPHLFNDSSERIEQPRGFHLDVPPRRLVWPTPNGKANFLPMPGLDVDTPIADPAMLRLATVRSHDQFNTTIYSYNDRMVPFMNVDDRLARGLPAEARVMLETFSEDVVQRRMDGLTILDYPMPRGAVAGYFPELNPLLPLEHYDRNCGTPAAKSIPVRVVASPTTRGAT